jgi:hypothetical protein
MSAINTAIPANRRRFGSAEKTEKKIAKPQQPSTTIAGINRLSGSLALVVYTRLAADAFTALAVVVDDEFVRATV